MVFPLSLGSGETIRQIYLQTGSFEKLELELEKRSQQSSSNNLAGGWHNEVSLRETLKWDACFSGTSTLMWYIIVVVYAYFGNTCEYHQIPNCCVHLRDMIKNSKEWARKRGLIQTNEVHGKEEWKIPTERTFSFKNDVTQSVRMHASTTVQDFQGCYGGVHMV